MTKVPKFKPKPGQVNFTNIRYAPVINCVVRYKNKILIVKRNPSMRLYPNYWNGISGFLDDNKDIKDKIYEEMEEELSLDSKFVKKFRVGEIFQQEEPKYNKTWIVHPILIDITTDKIKLDWEAQEYVWVSPKEALKYDLLPGFDGVLDRLFPK